jgi:transposase
VIQQALKWDEWRTIDESYQYQTLELGHYGIDQRWVIVRSRGALERASKTIDKKIAKEKKAADKQLFHLQAERFASEDEALDALKKIESKWTYHQSHHIETTQHIQYAAKGKPRPDSPIKAIKWQIQADLNVNTQQAELDRDQKSCFVLATSISALQLNDEEVFWGYKAQSHVERGFRFLKDPLFFASSLFVKKPCRIEGMLVVDPKPDRISSQMFSIGG